MWKLLHSDDSFDQSEVPTYFQPQFTLLCIWFLMKVNQLQDVQVIHFTTV